MGSAFKNLFKKESSTEDEIKQLVEEDEQVGQLEKNQREMINNIFEFDDLDAGDIMTHRIDINALDCNLSIEKAVELAIEYGNSRLPVYDEDLDRICGVLYVKDLLKFVGKPISNGEKLLSYTRKPLFVPESMPCGKLFAKMTEARVTPCPGRSRSAGQPMRRTAVPTAPGFPGVKESPYVPAVHGKTAAGTR